ncbi:MAG: polyprenyl synthetase family protein [Acidimicrobiales bacterium]|nr:polyprenyl synthetase family protein [Acidimicrobiales bacterium]
MDGAVSPPPSLVEIADRVEARLRCFLEQERGRWSAIDPELGPAFSSLERLVLGGGKRLRPAFCHWAFVGAGGDPDDHRVVDAGAAFELLHAFALFHDDVMDGSPTRRGARTTHLEFAAHHALSGWRGEARRFGEGVAILVGDLAFVYADLLLVEAPRPAIDVWNELRVELNVGQYLDVVGTAKGHPTEAQALRIARYKSGKYTVERPLHLGAALAGRLDDLVAPLSAYGLPLGDAFQLRDDVLGAFGDAATTGKPVGDDLREGKPTPLLAIASSRAGTAATPLLDRVGAPDLADDEVTALQALLVDTGAVAEVEATVESLTGEAIAALERADLTADAKEALVQLAVYVARRDR